MDDENEYLQYLLKLINPVQNLALYSYCIELCLSDQQLTAEEDGLLSRIAGRLDISNEDKNIIDKLITQRKAVEIEKIF